MCAHVFLHLCAHIWMPICISAYVYECFNTLAHCVLMFVYFSVCLHWHLYVTPPVCLLIVMCLCVFICVCVFLCLCVGVCVCGWVCVWVCTLYVGHLISPLASCALTSIPSLPFLLSLMGNLAMFAWHLAIPCLVTMATQAYGLLPCSPGLTVDAIDVSTIRGQSC